MQVKKNERGETIVSRESANFKMEYKTGQIKIKGKTPEAEKVIEDLLFKYHYESKRLFIFYILKILL